MKYLVLLILFLTSSNAFSQEKKLSYYFDVVSETNSKQYNINLNSRDIYFRNTKDSTYALSLHQNKDSVYAILYDYKESILVNFNVDFVYNNENDLKKLNNVRLYRSVTFDRGRKYKKHFEDFEYEKDTIKNQTLVHITQYKNSKKKKIINEHYYYFTNKESISSLDKFNIKDYLIKKYNLNEIKNQNLEKFICIVDGKKQSETEFFIIKKIDYTFSFTADQIFPKTNTFTNRIIYTNTTQ